MNGGVSIIAHPVYKRKLIANEAYDKDKLEIFCISPSLRVGKDGASITIYGCGVHLLVRCGAETRVFLPTVPTIPKGNSKGNAPEHAIYPFFMAESYTKGNAFIQFQTHKVGSA